jgi:hypothetical protein
LGGLENITRKDEEGRKEEKEKLRFIQEDLWY